jgi:thermitase
MSVSSKLALIGAVALVSAYQSSAFADEIYEIPNEGGPSALSISALSSTDVVDSIPQLGIIVTRSKTAGAKARMSGLRSLGEVGTVQLITPFASAPETVPTTLWGLKAIGLAKAWPISKGAGVVVAVSDTGVAASHPDLAGQMWKNPGETGVDSKGRNKASNGVDDDGDGLVDDVYGWNYAKDIPSGTDNHFHGSHVAGTIAAKVSKTMAGVAPRAKIMDVSFLDSKGSGSDVNGAKTIVYAADHGAKIINCSWGSTSKNSVLEKAIAYAESRGVLVVAAAGNKNTNNDKKAYYPVGYNVNNIIGIGATSNEGGARADFSNYGQKSVEIAAPGDNIRSLYPSGGYQNLSGTSMATPHVSGVAALVWSAHPQYTYAQVKKALMATRSASGWKKKSITEGQLDAELALTH